MSFFQSVISISRLDRGIPCLHLVIPHSDRDLGIPHPNVDSAIPHF